MWLLLVTSTTVKLDPYDGANEITREARKGMGFLQLQKDQGQNATALQTHSSIEMQPKYAISTKFFRIRFI